jgi:hypothetical protein
MTTLLVDVVGAGIQSEAYPMSRTVKGEIRIASGDDGMDARIKELFRQTALEAYELLGGPTVERDAT